MPAENRVTVALVGASGFGAAHLAALQKLEAEGVVRLAAVCDVNAGLQGSLPPGLPFYQDYRQMLEALGKTVDYVTLCTPLHLHADMAVHCLQAGAHLLLEKPPAVLPGQHQAISRAAKQHGRLCGVNYLMSADAAFCTLKSYLAEGRLGRLHSITGTGLYRRGQSYFARTPWAGRLAYNGQLVRDGTVYNPLSHLLNAMLMLAKAAGSGPPVRVQANLQHANAIESEDTACVTAQMQNGAALGFYGTLCAQKQLPPQVVVKGEAGTALWQYPGRLALPQNVPPPADAPPGEDALALMHRNMAGAVAGKEKLLCSIDDTRWSVRVADAAFVSCGPPGAIPPNYLCHTRENGEDFVQLENVEHWMGKASENAQTLTAVGCPWAVEGTPVALPPKTETNG